VLLTRSSGLLLRTKISVHNTYNQLSIKLALLYSLLGKTQIIQIINKLVYKNRVYFAHSPLNNSSIVQMRLTSLCGTGSDSVQLMHLRKNNRSI